MSEKISLDSSVINYYIKQKIHKGKYEICFSYFPLKKHASKSPHHLISMIIMRIRSSVYLHPRRCEYRHCPVRPTFRRLWHNR